MNMFFDKIEWVFKFIFREWKEVATQQKQGLNLEIKFCTQVASLEMSFGLQINLGLLKPQFRLNLILSTLLSAGECMCFASLDFILVVILLESRIVAPAL